MTRPDNVPEGALWNSEAQEWEHGPTSDDGRRTGAWTTWRANGERCGSHSYDDQGRRHGLVERFHPNGELAQRGQWVHGRVHGVLSWTLSTDGLHDRLSLAAGLPKDVMRMDMPFHHGIPARFHFTLLNEDGIDIEFPVDESGCVLDLAEHLDHVLPESTLLMLEPGTDVWGNEFPALEQSTRWLFDRPDGENFRVREGGPGTSKSWHLSPEMLSRCFTLSAPAYIQWIESQRPDGVPANAHYDNAEKLWRAGPLDEHRRFGMWRAWDTDGNLRGEEHYNDEGKLHGPCRLLYPDGALERSGQHADHKRSGRWVHHRHDDFSSKVFPNAADNVWSLERFYGQLGTEMISVCYLRDGAACDRNGEPISLNYDDTRFANGVVEGWFRREVVDSMVPQWEPGVFTERSRDLWKDMLGFADLDVDDVLTFALERPSQSFWAWNWPIYVDGRAAFMRGNIFETLLESAHHRPVFAQMFYGGVAIGKQDTPSHHSYLLALADEVSGDAARAPVFAQSFENRKAGPAEAVAVDLDHFAFLTHAFDELGWRRLSPEGFSAVWQRVSGHVAPVMQLGGYAALAASDDFSPWRPTGLLTPVLERRSRWLVHLLSGHDVADVVPLLELDDGDLASELYRTSNAVKYPWIGLYVMWRRFFFDEEAELRELLELAKSSPSRLVRDCAQVVHEVIWGREHLVWIEDIHDVRDAFAELNLKHPSQR